jgi:hypothetical protein
MSKQDTPLKQALPQRLMATLGSYGLCCLCLIMLFVLTLFGTLYQVDNGLYEAKKIFFNSWFLYRDVGSVSIPVFPGGVFAMSLLTVNLVVGGLLRMHWTMRNIGVIMIHFGIIFMLVAGLIKMTVAEEGHLTLWEIDSSQTEVDDRRSGHFQSYQNWEVTIWEVKSGTDGLELVIPDEHFSDLVGDKQRAFSSPHLPFELVLTGFIKNADVMPKGPQWNATGEVIDGYGILKLDTDPTAERNIAAMHGEIEVAGQLQRAILYGAQRSPWVVDVAGRRFAIDMRHERYPMPFDIRLEDFIKEDYAGMTMARSYRSEVTQIDGNGEEKILIQMNEPLRAGGLVLFQSSWGPQRNGVATGRPGDPQYSVFSVVRNPSDKWPEYCMWVIAIGLLITFSRTLFRFSKKQDSERKAALVNPS